MKESMIFPREKNGNIVPKDSGRSMGLRKIFRKPSAIRVYVAKKQMRYFRRINFQNALFTAYRNRDLSAFLMEICRNTMFDLLRNACLIPIVSMQTESKIP